MSEKSKISRRDILKLGSAGALGLAGSYFLNNLSPFTPAVKAQSHDNKHSNMDHSQMMGDTTKTSGYKMAEKLTD